jgi:hypothetical protein
MGFLSNLFGGQSEEGLLAAAKDSAAKRHLKEEIDRMTEELIKIGAVEDYLSERPGGSFNMDCRHRRACEIGKRLHEIGGIKIMEDALKRVTKKNGKVLGMHLSYAWKDIGGWVPL